VFSFEHHDGLGKGAYTLDGSMIDAPVYKQVGLWSLVFGLQGVGGRIGVY
jgi:hypothetical protein